MRESASAVGLDTPKNCLCNCEHDDIPEDFAPLNFQANPNFDCRLEKRHMWCRQTRWLYSMTLSRRERQMSPDIDSQWVCRFVTAVWPDSNEAAFRAAFRQVHTQRGHSRPPSKAKKGWKLLSLALPPQCQPPFTKIQWFTVGVAAVIIGFSKCVRITTTKDNQTVRASHKTFFHHDVTMVFQGFLWALIIRGVSLFIEMPLALSPGDRGGRMP